MLALFSLALSLTTAQAVTLDGNVITVSTPVERKLAAEVDVLTVQLFASDAKEWEAAIRTVTDAEERIRALALKDEPTAIVRALVHQANGQPPNGGSLMRMLEVRVPNPKRTQMLASRIAMVRGVSSIATTHDLADRTKASSESRRAAVEFARAKADDYAVAVGRKLGKMVTLIESAEVMQPPGTNLFVNITNTITLKITLE